jgi:nucleoside-diphosphate-sugar epimerase
MKILVIGGTRFIGLHVVHRLIQLGHQVTVFHRGVTQAHLPSTVNHIYGDRQHLEEYRQEFQNLKPDVVLDMTALTEFHARSTVEVLRGLTQRVVVISSQDVYRARDIIWGRETDAIDLVPLTEEAPLRTQLYPYRELAGKDLMLPPDYDKILVERIVMREPDLPATVLRLPMVYGEGDYIHRVHPFLKRMDENRPVIILEESYARWRGSYGYVENVAGAIALTVTDSRAANRIYNVAERSHLSQAESIAAIGKVAGWFGEVVIVPKSQIPASSQSSFNLEQDWLTDSTRIREELNYAEVVDREEALGRTITWERLNPPQTPSLIANTLLDYETENAILALRQ